MFSSLLNEYVPYLRSRCAAAAAVAIFRRSVERVWGRVSQHIVQMSEAEALGYTRAHAAGVIESAAREVFTEQHVGLRAQAEALRDATQRIVECVWQRAQEAKQVMDRRRAA
ncbi:MAG TPA: hypothetical protein VGE52_07715 [Pirellulales bacterium]